jgi:hypothetical protein
MKMTDQQLPITPPPELVQQWLTEGHHQDYCSAYEYAIAKAARWGADQELEACCKWMLNAPYGMNLNTNSSQLRAARRPKPPTLKEQALAALGPEPLPKPGPTGDTILNAGAIERHRLVRRALEALPDVKEVLDCAHSTQAELQGPTDEELAITARKAIEDYRYCTELPYFLRDDSSEYEPFLLILRAVLEKYGKTTSGESIEVNPAMAEPQSLLPKTLADMANAEYTDAVLRGDCVPIQKMPMLRRALEKLWDLEHHNG